MGLNKDMTDLLDNIKRSMIFYIPSIVFKTVEKNYLDELESYGILNTMFYMDAKGDFKVIANGTEYVALLSKNKILKSNVFELLDLKTRLDKNAFHYLIDDYFIELESQIFLTDVICKEAKHTTANYKPEIQGFLELQYNQLIEHQEELKQKFGSWKSKFELDRIFSVFDNKSIDAKQDKKVREFLEVKFNSEKSKPNKKFKDKGPILSETEVDKYLLKTTFSLDFSKIEDKTYNNVYFSVK